MTIDEQARTTIEDLGLDRTELLIGAKAIAQEIIEESTSTDRPLQGMVYDVWGLYNDGTPKCSFATNKDGDLVFTAQFHTDENDVHEVKRRAISPDTLKQLCNPHG
ncbi:MAG: hypothetical protein PPP56_05515 [Longimonas sp.]|uniref:hypothetical protein n=1 Tax=Longimonas sp. TaxID=2039626 RepID=UPI0033623B58